MFDFFRNALKSWLFRFILFGLLIVSFGLWGVGDVFQFFSPSGGAVITVDGEEIDDYKFLSAYREQSNRLLRNGFPQELIARSGIEQAIIGRISRNSILRRETKNLSFAISDDILRRSIEDAEAFQGQSGRFDVGLFQNFLFSRGLNEPAFLEELRDELSAGFIEETFLYDTGLLPEQAVKFEQVWQNEQRDIRYVIQPIRRDETLDDPGGTVLQKWIEENANLFLRPEYRSLEFIHLDPEELKKDLSFSETTLRDIFEQTRENYVIQERRDYEQIFFAEEEEAIQAHIDLQKRQHRSLEPIAEGKNISRRNNVTRSGISDPIIATRVFSLKKDEISQAFEGRLGWYLVQLKTVKAGREPNFTALRQEIEQRAKNEAALEALFAKIEEAEDALILGKSIQDMASSLGFYTQKITLIDQNGIAQNGTLSTDLPEDQNFLTTAFSLEPNRVSDPLESSEGAEKNGFYLIEINAIEASRSSELSEIRERAFLSWQEAEHSKKARAVLEKIQEDFEKGISFENAARGQQKTVRTEKAITRDSAFLSPDIVRRVFQSDKNKSEITSAPRGNLILYLVENVQNTKTGDATEENTTPLQQMASDTLQALYFNNLRQEYDIRINRNRLDFLIGNRP